MSNVARPRNKASAGTQGAQSTDRQAKLDTLKQRRYLATGVDGPETREDIKRLQSKLVEVGALRAGTFKGGVFDETTKAGVIRFQQEMKGRDPDMLVDGKVGQQTWASFDNFKVHPGVELLKAGGAPEAADSADKGWQPAAGASEEAPNGAAPSAPAPNAPAANAPAANAPAANAPAANAPAANAPAANAPAPNAATSNAATSNAATSETVEGLATQLLYMRTAEYIWSRATVQGP